MVFHGNEQSGVLNNERIVLPTALKPMMAIFLDFAGMTDSSSCLSAQKLELVMVVKSYKQSRHPQY